MNIEKPAAGYLVEGFDGQTYFLPAAWFGHSPTLAQLERELPADTLAVSSQFVSADEVSRVSK